MKGIIFNILEDFVVETRDMAFWNDTLLSVSLPSGGIYTAGGTYDDDEIIQLIGYLSKQLGMDIPEIVRSFGLYLFPHLLNSYPAFQKTETGLFGFLKSVDEVIHVEVEKLYRNTNLPKLDVVSESETVLILNYRSQRKLCHLAEGLIDGAARHYGNSVSVYQSQCMHSGANCCHIEIKIEN